MTDTQTPQIFPNFPVQPPWIVNPEQIAYAGEVIMAIAGGVLDQTPDPTTPGGSDTGVSQSRGARYRRRVLTTGQDPPISPNDELDGQLIVSGFEIFIGRAGEQRFQFFKGDLGTYAQRVFRFQVTLGRRAPKVEGGISPRMQRPEALAGFAESFWIDGWLVWSALLAMCLGGVKDQNGDVLSPAPIPQDNVLIGPLALLQSQGGVAKATIEVQVQV